MTPLTTVLKTCGVLETYGDDRQDPIRNLESGYSEDRLADNGKTFRTKRDAEDWSRRTEDEMVPAHTFSARRLNG